METRGPEGKTFKVLLKENLTNLEFYIPVIFPSKVKKKLRVSQAMKNLGNSSLADLL